MRSYARGTPRDSAKDLLIAEYAPMARRIALRVARNVPSWITKDDLIATAMVGLAEAADRFEPSEGVSFVAFAERRVRGAVLDELRKGDVLPRRVRSETRRIGRVIRKLEGTLGRPPEDEEIAGALGVELEDYQTRLAHLSGVSFVDLGKEALATPEAAEDSDPEAAAAKKQLAARVREGLDHLVERDVTILSLYYVEELTYAEIGRVLGVSESRVCQLHSRALARLQAELDPEIGA